MAGEAAPARIMHTSCAEPVDRIGGYPIHPAAKLFPPLDLQAYADLVASIRSSGVIFPIVLYEGAILDGCHRARACEEVGKPPHYVEYEGEEPYNFVVAANLRRRQLTARQRKIVAAELIRESPGKSSRRIALDTGFSVQCIRNARREMEARDLGNSPAISDTPVRVRPAMKLAVPEPSERATATRALDPERPTVLKPHLGDCRAKVIADFDALRSREDRLRVLRHVARVLGYRLTPEDGRSERADAPAG